MFQIFLRKKLLSPDGTLEMEKATKRRSKNRRLFDRYDVNAQHLTIAHQDDILVIREISAKGFSSAVSERAAQSLQIGDTYEGRMRHMGEFHDLTIRVAWKNGDIIGFEFISPSITTLKFLQRLILPIEIANTLKQVDAEFMRDNKDGKLWFHADQADLFVWKPEAGPVRGWRLVIGPDFVEWSMDSGIVTGTISQETSLGATSLTVPEPDFVPDAVVNAEMKQFAIDLMMAIHHDLRVELLTTLITS